MKKISILLLFIICSAGIMAQNAGEGMVGILLVHYGTQNDESRSATIDRLNAEIKAEFSSCAVAEAYAAPSVIKALRKRGIEKNTIAQAIDSLYEAGCRRLVVQSTMLLDGVMTDMLRAEVKEKAEKFSSISIGRPLLYSVDDCRRLTSMIATHLKGMKHLNAGKAQVVLVGHGSDSPANAMYSQIDYLLKDEGRPLWHVGTIEGYPTIDNVEHRLAGNKEKNVVLVPLLYIAGNHQRDDINGTWRTELTRKGYTVSVVSEGLGEMKEVRGMVVDNIRRLIKAQEK